MKLSESLQTLWKESTLPASSLVVIDDYDMAKSEIINFLENILSEYTSVSPENNTDIVFVEPDYEKKTETIPIDDLRILSSKFSSKSGITDYKFGIIIAAENMTISASNSILKLLEDTYDNAFLILVTKNQSNLISTINSRCIKIFDNPNKNDRNKLLEDEINSMLDDNIKFEDKQTKISNVLSSYSEKDIINSMIYILGDKVKKSVSTDQNMIDLCMSLREKFMKAKISALDIKSLLLLSIAKFSCLN